MHQIRLTWDGKSSVIYSAIVNCYAIMHMGTLDHTYLIDASNKAWVAKCSHWGKFSSVSCLGSIHKNNDAVGGILNEWGKLGTDDEYAKGGRAYATGLALAGSKNLEKTGLMWEDIKSGKEPQIHGGLLGIGLLNYASADLSLVEEMKGLLFAESATQGEAAGYGIGLIMTGHLDDNLLAELIQSCEENSHEKIVRAISLAIAMMCFGQEENADVYIKSLIESKDHVVRYGGVLAIGMAYAGTGNNIALKKLLSLAASDVSDDVRRSAVMAMGYLMLADYDQMFKVISLLYVSFNPHVRYGAAMALGIACANTCHPEAIKILEELLNDNVDFVKQGAAIGLAFVLQQATKANEPKVETFKEKLMEKIKKKSEDALYKWGCIVAIGILDAGGRNSVVKLISEARTIKRGAITGMLLFTQYWYWFPLTQMLSLSLEPTCLIGVNQDLKLPIGFEFKCNTKKSTFDYPPILKADDKKGKDKKKIQLSTTLRVQAKAQLKSGGKDTTQKDVAAVAGGEEPKKEDDNKMDEEKIEEPSTHILHNPSRILRTQQKFIEYLEDGRYRPLLKNRKRGYIWLEDTTPNEHEAYVDELPLEAWLIPPPDFVFDPSAQVKHEDAA